MNDEPFLVCYDITCPKRLQRIHRVCCRIGTPYQYSVFLVEGRDDLDQLLEELDQIINPDTDDVRAYRIGGADQITVIGERVAPDDIFFV